MFWNKVKVIAMALLVAGVFVAGAGALPRQQGTSGAAAPPTDKSPPSPSEAGSVEPKETERSVDRHGDALPPGALARMGTVRFRHGGGVMRILFSPDAKFLVSADGVNFVRVWDAASGKEIRRLPAQDAYLCLAFREGGKVLVTRSASRDDSGLHVWDIATGKDLRSIPNIEARSHNELSPDGKTLATADFKGKVVYLHDLDKGTETHQLEAGGVLALAFAPGAQNGCRSGTR